MWCRCTVESAMPMNFRFTSMDVGTLGSGRRPHDALEGCTPAECMNLNAKNST